MVDTLISAGSAWRYSNDDAPPSDGWNTTSFDDAAWDVGNAELGYGEGDEATTVGFGGDASDKPITTYFRHQFNVHSLGQMTDVSLYLKRDDGATAYLNGVEVVRDGLPIDATHSTPATTAVDDGDDFHFFSIDPALFQLGTNLLAIEVHQDGPASDDLSFDVQLTANRDGTSGVLENDTDPENDNLLPIVIQTTTNGTLDFNSDGTFTYEPNAGFVGDDQFTYYVSDGTSLSNAATVTIHVGEDAAAPTADADSYSAVQNAVFSTPAAAGVLANDSDIDGDTLSAVLVTSPAHGDLVLHSNGSFEYTPNGQFVGEEVFEYVAIDGGFHSEIIAVTIDVQSVPNVPSAQSDSYSVLAGTTLVANGTGASVSLNNNQRLWAIEDGGNGHVYEHVERGHAWIDASKAANSKTLGGTNGHLATLTNQGEFSFVVGSLGASNAWLGGYQDIQAPDFSEPSGGWRWITDELWDFTRWNGGEPNGDRESFLVTNGQSGQVWNDLAGYQGTSSYLVEYPLVSPIRNDVLISTGDTWRYLDDGSDQGVLWRFPGIDESAWKTGSAEFGYGDGDEQTHINSAHVTTYFRKEFDVANSGSVERAEVLVKRDDGIIVYLNGTEIVRNGLPSNPHYRTTAPNAFDDGAEFFRFSVPPSLLVEGTNVIAAEVHQDRANASDMSFDMQFTATFSVYNGVLANDYDPEQDSISALLVTGPSHGTLNLNTNGMFDYTPDAGFAGTDTFVYRATDGIFQSAPATVTIDVVDANDAPVAVNDSYQASADQTLQVSAEQGILANDTDDGQGLLEAQLVVSPEHGALQLNANGSFSYSPDPQFVGTDEFVYRVSDGERISQLATATITVTRIADIPVASDDFFSVAEDGTLIVENGLQQSIHEVSVGGDLQRIAYDPIRDTLFVTVEDSNQVVPIDPNTGTLGRPIVIPSNPNQIVATDDGQYLYVGANGANAIVRLDLQTRTIDKSISLGGNWAADLHVVPGQPLSIAVAKNNWGGVEIFDDGTKRPQGDQWNNQIEFNDDGSILYGFSSDISSYDIKRFNVSPTGLQFVTAVAWIDGVGRGGFEFDDGKLFFESGAILDADSLTKVGQVNRPSGGEVIPLPYSDRIVVLADETDTIRIYNAEQQQIDQIVVPGEPSAHHGLAFDNDKLAFVDDGNVYIIQSDLLSGVTRHDIMANDIDPEGDFLTASLVQAPQNGSLDLNADGTFTYRPNEEYSGIDTFTYTVSDGQFVSAPATVTITVRPVNDAPHTQPDTFQIPTIQSLNVTAEDGVLANDSDPEGESISAVLVTGPSHGTVDLDEDGSFTYVPGPSFALVDSFTYSATDGLSDSDPVTVTIALDVPRIEIGDLFLRPNTANQQVPLYVHSGKHVSGANLYLQVGDGGPELSDYGVAPGTAGPTITNVDLKTGTIFASVTDPQIDQPGIPQVATTTIAISEAGQSVLADGVLATVTFDTTGFLEGTWDFLLDNVLPFAELSGPFHTDFAGVPAHISSGRLIIRETEVVGRHLFYEGSEMGQAIAKDKRPLLPGQSASFANYSSYDKGINGLAVDVVNLIGVPTIDDFEFTMGRNADFDSWVAAPSPTSFDFVAGGGGPGTDRVLIRWADGDILNRWLKVTIAANETTGLPSADVFYFGNAPGDTGDSLTNALVNATDVVNTRDNKKGPFNGAAIDDPYDFNRDGLVNATDVVFARDNITSPFTALQLITPPLEVNAVRTPRAPLPIVYQTVVPDAGDAVTAKPGISRKLAIARVKAEDHSDSKRMMEPSSPEMNTPTIRRRLTQVRRGGKLREVERQLSNGYVQEAVFAERLDWLFGLSGS